jgi:hypothetical protein
MEGMAGKIMSVERGGKAVRRARSGTVSFKFLFKYSLELPVFSWKAIARSFVVIGQ